MIPRSERIKAWRNLRGVELIKDILKESREAEEIISYESGCVLDYSPQSLKRIDEFNLTLKALKELGNTFGFPFVYAGEGSFFAEVILRNIGGEWRYPSEARLAVMHFLLSMGIAPLAMNIAFRRCDIELNGRFIPVLKIAKMRLKGDKRVRSLFETYEKIRTTGNWR